MSAPEITSSATGVRPSPAGPGGRRKVHDGGVEHVPTVIVGAGQSGLAVAHHLERRGEPYALLDGDARVGDSWRRRWDSLRLFSLPRNSSLPGLRLGGEGYPARDAVADYLERYARTFALPVRSGVRVLSLTRAGGRFRLRTTAGDLTADRVVVCTGANSVPRRPAFAEELRTDIRQWHSHDYRRPAQLVGRVLVVGAGSSGTDLAWEAARSGHPTVIAGPSPGEVPIDIDRPLGRLLSPPSMYVARSVLTLANPAGRRAANQLRTRGHPVLRRRRRVLAAAGVRAVGRVTHVEHGLPVADGVPLDVDTVLWCTGYRTDFSWIDLPVTAVDGRLAHRRGISATVPGLGFVGQEFQWSAASSTLNGVDADARYVVAHLTAGSRSRATADAAGGAAAAEAPGGTSA